MKKVLFGFALIIASLTFGQKVKLKDDIALVDGKEYIKVVEDKAVKHNFKLMTLEGKNIGYVKYTYYQDSKAVEKTNPEGYVSYFEVVSSDLNTSYFETFSSIKEVVKILYNSDILDKDSNINSTELEALSKKIGFEFSRRRENSY
ncbi:hypothetical protein J3D55_002963 [Chryseobacterium ginsenosidimutans]|uniref:hypothetical protein n=1 Tax=Chryseobacterium ginsenosidimutans TaxID=687846 RepID=UPI002169B5C9|nr:hypothetical protein [Chryseobacterium ginsenosidimutans]MCS3870047.1 hypothetical protein [Chryseobacterium ginsenosidimutans]